MIKKPNDIKRLGNILGNQFGTGYAGNVWDQDYICPALMTAQGGYREPMIIEVKDNERRSMFKISKNRIRKENP